MNCQQNRRALAPLRTCDKTQDETWIKSNIWSSSSLAFLFHLPNRSAPSTPAMDANINSLANSIVYTRIVSVSFCFFRFCTLMRSTHRQLNEVRQWFVLVSFPFRKFNVLTNRMLAGSIAILVRQDSWSGENGVEAE